MYLLWLRPFSVYRKWKKNSMHLHTVFGCKLNARREENSATVSNQRSLRCSPEAFNSTQMQSSNAISCETAAISVVCFCCYLYFLFFCFPFKQLNFTMFISNDWFQSVVFIPSLCFDVIATNCTYRNIVMRFNVNVKRYFAVLWFIVTFQFILCYLCKCA